MGVRDWQVAGLKFPFFMGHAEARELRAQQEAAHPYPVGSIVEHKPTGMGGTVMGFHRNGNVIVQHRPMTFGMEYPQSELKLRG